MTEGWVKKKFRQIAKDEPFSIGDGDHGLITAKDYVEMGIPLIRIVDLNKNGTLNLESTKKITKEAHDKVKKSWLKHPDVLVSKTGTLGRTCIIPDIIKTANTTSSVAKISLNEKIIKPKYFHQFILSNEFKKQLSLFYTKTAQPGFNNGEFEVFEIKFPKILEEQQKIADILTKVDETIEFTENIITKDERIKKGLMQDLFSTEKNMVSIENITELVGSGVTPRGGDKVYIKQGIIFLRSQNIYPEGLKLSNVAHINKGINDVMKRTQTKDFDVLLNITGASIGRSTFIPERFPDANVNQHVCILRLKNKTKADAFLLSSLLNSDIGQKQIKALNAGSNREGLNFQQAKSMEFPFPKDEVKRKEISSIISSIDSKIQKEKQELNKLKSIKEGLMQDLLTGNKQKEVTCMIKEAVA